MSAKAVLITFKPRNLKDQLQNDPTLLGLIQQGYTIGTSCVLVEGPEGPEQEQAFALIMMPPQAAPVLEPIKMSRDFWIFCGLLVALGTGQLVLGVAALFQLLQGA